MGQMLVDGARAHGKGLRTRRAGLVADAHLLLVPRRLLGRSLFLILFPGDLLRGLLVVGQRAGA
ncbi:MAG: hypothetical protein ACRDNE_06685 [Gaiellaceae bacterium]